MKLAIIGSGQCRKLTRTHLNKAFADANKDFYFHTWEHEHNPHWDKLQKFFPDATIEIEKYEDHFDKYRQYRNITSDKLRYEFAQFYTVLKSFKLVEGEYDYYFRTRTDIGYQSDILNFFTENHNQHKDLRRWTWHAIKQTTDQETWRQLVPDNLERLLINQDELDNRVMELKPIVWAPLRMADPIHGASFDDFSWTMNNKAFSILKNLDMEYIMRKAMDIKLDSEFSIQSPLIWSKIMQEEGIYIITAPVSGHISRLQAEEQDLIPFYGDTN